MRNFLKSALRFFFCGVLSTLLYTLISHALTWKNVSFAIGCSVLGALFFASIKTISNKGQEEK